MTAGAGHQSELSALNGAGGRWTAAGPLLLAALDAAQWAEVTAEQLESLTALLKAAEGVTLAAAETHPRTNLVCVALTVEAGDLYEPHHRACALVHDHVGRAGLAPAILVAARPATTRRTGRMG